MRLKILQYKTPIEVLPDGSFATFAREFAIDWFGADVTRPWWHAHTTDGHYFEHKSAKNIRLDGKKLKLVVAIEVVA